MVTRVHSWVQHQGQQHSVLWPPPSLHPPTSLLSLTCIQVQQFIGLSADQHLPQNCPTAPLALDRNMPLVNLTMTKQNFLPQWATTTKTHRSRLVWKQERNLSSKQPSCCVYVRLCISTLSCLIPQPCATAVSGSRVRLTSSSFVLALESLWSHCSSKKKKNIPSALKHYVALCITLSKPPETSDAFKVPPLPSQQTVSG